MIYVWCFVTIGLLCLMALIYLSNSIKSPAMEKLMGFIRPLVDNISVISVAYGIVAACATPLMIATPKYMFPVMLADVMLIIVSLPYMLHKFERSLENKTNAAVLGEIRSSLSFITNNEKIFGILAACFAAGVVAALLRLF